MNVSEYIVDRLIKHGVTDTFGVPGGVILKLLYAMQDRFTEITPHLNYHEQMAGFAACGYAQAGNKLGVAYATRGPGITNMITCMAESYQESLPVLFITAHGNRRESVLRYEFDQELELTQSVSRFTKYSANVDDINDVVEKLEEACRIAMDGRKGPVFLDFSSKLFDMEMNENHICKCEKKQYSKNINLQECNVINLIRKYISKSKRPIILIGDGMRKVEKIVKDSEYFNNLGIPILSSRGAHDILSKSEYYFGYIGSHGNRYSNFILSKTDLIICIGNRLSFPVDSKSFAPIVENATVIRLDVDEAEFLRKIPNSINHKIDVDDFINELIKSKLKFEDRFGWIDVCKILKEKLDDYDLTVPVKKLSNILRNIQENVTYVCDVGNNEFWFSRAYELIRPDGNVLYSKSFGTVGSALGRSIGAYYASEKDVICVIGDQGFQYNLQELQYIAYWNIPIKIILLNNTCSGMIADHENEIFPNKYVHVNPENGYSVPDFEKIIKAYGIKYVYYEDINDIEINTIFSQSVPMVYEIQYDSKISLVPNLPKGNLCQKMEPGIEEQLYEFLEEL
ncbi:thiamine pyrophosphate-binding protein [Clostridium butyricum]|uniref:thiamine pyrophosphate-binding protein n=1 Tax=Clostridium butyricum TaxID=1492 RepID=UPI00374E5EDB